SELELIAGQRESTVLTHLAHELGVRANPKARVWGGPLIARPVGAHGGADLVAVGLDEPALGIRMLVDVGTNTEVVLAGNGRILVTSCPAGPDSECGSVSYRSEAAEGAIESVELDAGGDFVFRTIGDAPPLG